MIEIQCFETFDSDTGRKLYFARIKGCKAMLQGKTCRIDQLGNPGLPAVPYFFFQKMIQVFLMAFTCLDHRILHKID